MPWVLERIDLLFKKMSLAQRPWKRDFPPERQNDMHRFLVRICEDAGPREPGSEAERKAAEIVKGEFEKHCDRVHVETFQLAPKGFLSFTVLSPAFVLIGIPFYWFYPIITCGLCVLAMFVFYMQFLRYAEFVDFLYPKKTSRNVIGEIDPRREWKQTLMLSAHVDSAYQFNFNLYMPRAFDYFQVGLPILLVLLTVLSLTFYLSSWVFSAPRAVFDYSGAGLIAIIVPMATLLFFFKTNWAVMGANDNLSGIAILQGLAESLGNRKEVITDHTKVLLVAFGSEEAGLRGSKRWVERHREDLEKRPFFFLNFDGIAKRDDIHVIHREKTLGVVYNPEVVEMVAKAAEAVGVHLECRELPFGATDGSAIVCGGFSNGASVEAMDIDKPEVKRWYHTINDTADEVEPEALELARKLSMKFVQMVDERES